MKSIKLIGALIICIILSSAFSTQNQIKDISGIYETVNSGERMIYYITQRGNAVYGFADAFSARYSFVFKAYVDGDKIVDGKWYSIPKGTVKGQGEMNFNIERGGSIELSGSNGFPSNSIEKYDQLHDLPKNKIEGFNGDATNEPTGRYMANNAMQIWLNQPSKNKVVFFGQTMESSSNNNRPGMASVFFGNRNGNTFSGEWIDLPLGYTNSNGKVTYEIHDGYLYFRDGYFPGITYNRK